MIDSKQLRLGNIVQVKICDGIVDSIHEHMLTFKNINGGFCPIINVSPKRIDDDILKKFGFECIETKKVSIMKVEYISKKYVFGGWMTIEKEDQDIDAELSFDVNDDLFDVFFNEHFITTIEHVHELQNLYFTIKKEELPYEEV